MNLSLPQNGKEEYSSAELLCSQKAKTRAHAYAYTGTVRIVNLAYGPVVHSLAPKTFTGI